MENKVFFKIADHVLEVNFPADFILLDYLPNFNLFIMNDEEIRIAQEPKLKVSISLSRVQHFDEKLKVHTESSEIWGEGFKFEEGISCFITSWTDLVENTKFAVVSSKDFTESTVYLGEGNDNKFQMISWALMVVFGQAVLPYNTLMIHASAVEKDGKEAYAFLGKSGTGKSTHSQLWLKYLNNFTLLNDDNPAIRVFEDNKVFIYGTPWSGKTDCYRNDKVPLKGIVRLQQAELNCFQLKNNAEAFMQLLPSCSGIRWNLKLFNGMLDTIQIIQRVVPVGLLKCKINREAAELSYNGIK